MEPLLSKFRNNTLTSDELHRLREYFQEDNDENLSGQIEYDGNSQRLAEDLSTEESVKRAKQRIDSRIGSEYRGLHYIAIPKWLAAVASVAILILLLSVVWLMYPESQKTTEIYSDNRISTESNHDVSMVLSDGTKVRLRRNSVLSYPAFFSESSRKVDFVGEAYFDVAGLDGIPFCISSPGMEVVVKGTSFVLNSRPDELFSELSLYEGIVDLTSTISNETITLKSGNIARLNNSNGKISVSQMRSDLTLDWNSDEIHFQNVSPDSLIYMVEDHYDIILSDSVRNAVNSNFSGTLPFNDIDITMTVLGRIYGFEKVSKPYRSSH